MANKYAPPVKEHGYHMYRRHGCRCDVCRKGNAVRCSIEYADRAARLKADPSIRQHGNATTYHNWSCRCTPCKTAMWVAIQVRTGTPVKRRDRLLYFDQKPTKAEAFGREWLNE